MSTSEVSEETRVGGREREKNKLSLSKCYPIFGEGWIQDVGQDKQVWVYAIISLQKIQNCLQNFPSKM